MERLPAAGLRALCFALLLACSAAALNGCALQIVRAGPYKSSLQHHLYNNVLGIPAPGSVCISYADVNNAIYEATTRIAIVPPKGDWTPDDIGPVGEVLLEASRIIANKYRLSPLEIAHDLPLMDTRGTAAAAICPRYASPLKCIPGRYRRIDGLCNNLHNPTWGATRAVFTSVCHTSPAVTVLLNFKSYHYFIPQRLSSGRNQSPSIARAFSGPLALWVSLPSGLTNISGRRPDVGRWGMVIKTK
ncbi:hypothetical protein O3P69_001962 [Scylla paramamosain]|uniref:Uncharacterized protein n=1 Tax=Scylla paramamosain TaxID=85552 RepID=A0AAW0V5D9_SCYPA